MELIAINTFRASYPEAYAFLDHYKEDLKERNMDEVCLLYTSDAADERSSVDLGGRRIIKKKKS